MRRKAGMFDRMIAVMAVVALTASVASAEMIMLFSDTFSTDGALSGRDVEYVNPLFYPSGLTWESTGASASGGTVSVEGGHTNSGLAFTPLSGTEYLYEVVLTVGGSIGMGHQTAALTAGYDWWAQAVQPTLEGTTGPSGYKYGTVISNVHTFTDFDSGLANAAPSMNTMSWLLDATDADPANWTATFSINGTSFAPIAAPADIDIVGFGRYDNNYNFTVDSVSLSAIPEPASAGLMLLGAILGLGLRRRKLRG